MESPTLPVLSTMQQDGSRRWLLPRLSTGKWWHRRRLVAYSLMVLFVVVPHLRIAGKPILLLDIAELEFTILGKTFLPTDTMLLALLILSFLLSIVLITALAGRLWCGWACPQTVYMEYLFRPLDRLFDGTTGKGGAPRKGRSAGWKIARLVTYVLLCMFLAHTFLAYFVSPKILLSWIQSSPAEHPIAFLVMGGTTGLMLFDFLYFREQMCTLACPYGRFQSVMLDEQSLIVGYDHVRGEPRKKGKHHEGEAVGDCVDCNQCVVVCPTGIDIREGLQMECINCTQCIDACDHVMDSVGTPRGLIRYSSQDAIAGKKNRLLRPRTIIYSMILAVVFGGLAFALATHANFDAQLSRGRGEPYSVVRIGQVTNRFFLELTNRSAQTQTFTVTVVSPEKAKLQILDPERLTLPAGEQTSIPVNVDFPASLTRDKGNVPVELEVATENEAGQSIRFHLLGPR